MSSFKKYIAFPEDKLRALQNENSEKISKETVERIIQIALLLARVNCYNALYQIKGIDGRYVTNTKVISLIEKIDNEDPQLPGEEEFISLLSKAKVPLELIRNENFRERLKNLQENRENISSIYESVKGDNNVSHSSLDMRHRKKAEFSRITPTFHDFFITTKTITEERKK